MTKYIVVKCRGSCYKIYEDMTRKAQARLRRKIPQIPNFTKNISVEAEQHPHDEMNVFSKPI